jgi:hypothetical protein
MFLHPLKNTSQFSGSMLREPSLSRNDQQLLNVERVSPAAAPSEPSVSIEFNSTEIAQP